MSMGESNLNLNRQVVCLRVRPLIKREHDIHWCVSGNELVRLKSETQGTYVFDRVIGPEGSNLDVFNAVAKELVCGAVKGINGTIFAYGQTASGKTHTMLGSETESGVVSYSIEKLFDLVQEAKDRMFLISMEYKEIYNEEVNDLLGGETNLRIREDTHGSVYVQCQQELVQDASDFHRVLAAGDGLRRVGATNMNERSSRSHAIATLRVESKLKDDDDDGAVLVSQLNFVDLAGSEKAVQTGAEGQRLKEGCKINSSLLSLAQCMNKLAEKKGAQHVPYRDSKLTRLLQNSIGGNSSTVVIANVTPASIDETTSTLKFASRAKAVSTKPTVNEVVDEHTLTKRLQKRVKELELQLAQKHKPEDSVSREALIKELLKPQTLGEEILAKQRRMTWCGPKMAGPLLKQSYGEKDTLVESGAGFNAFQRPSFPGKVSSRRKRPNADRLATIGDIEDEAFVEPSQVFRLTPEKELPNTNTSTEVKDLGTGDAHNSQLDELRRENETLKGAAEKAAIEADENKSIIQTLLSDKADLETALAAALEKAGDFEKELKEVKDELIDYHNRVDLREHRILGLERGYDCLQKQYDELIDFSNTEREVYSCRTPGQVKEKQLRKEINDAERKHAAECNELKVTISRLVEENYKLQQGAEHPDTSVANSLQTIQESPVNYSPLPADYELKNEVMPPSLSLTFTDSPSTSMLDSLNRSVIVNRPNTVDAGVNTDIEIQWFEMDDTILGVKKTGAADNTMFNADESARTSQLVMSTPAKRLVLEVKEDVSEFKRGLQMTYETIARLNEQHVKSQQLLADRAQEITELRLVLDEFEGVKKVISKSAEKVCGTCDSPVLNCEHVMFVPTEDWQTAQQELVSQLEAQQKELDRLTMQLADVNTAHEQRIEVLKSEQEFLLQASKQQRMHQTDDSQPSNCEQLAELKAAQEHRLAEVSSAHEHRLAEVSSAHEHRLAEVSSAHEHRLAEVSSAHEQVVTQLKSELAQLGTRMTELQNELLMEREIVSDHEKEVEDLKSAHQLAWSAMSSAHESSSAHDSILPDSHFALSQQEVVAELQEQTNQLLAEKEKAVTELMEMKVSHQQVISKLTLAHEQSLTELVSQHDIRVEQLLHQNQQLLTEKQQIVSVHEKEVKDLESAHQLALYAKGSTHASSSAHESSSTHESSSAHESILPDSHFALSQQEVVAELREQTNQLLAEKEKAVTELMEMKVSHQQVISELTLAHEQSLTELVSQNNIRLEQLLHQNQQLLAEKQQIVSVHEKEVKDLDSAHQLALYAMGSIHESAMSDIQSALSQQQEQCNELSEKQTEATKEVEMLKEINEELSRAKRELTDEQVKFERRVAEANDGREKALKELKEKDAELDHLMEKALDDRRNLAAKYKASKETVAELEQQVHVLEEQMRTSASSSGTQLSMVSDTFSAEAAKIREQVEEEVKHRYKRIMTQLKSENQVLEDRVIRLRQKVDNPEEEVRKAQEEARAAQADSAQYHDELTDIDVKMDKFSYYYLNIKNCDIDSLLSAVVPHLSETCVKQAEKRKRETLTIDTTPASGSKIVESPEVVKGTLCPHLRKRQHARIVALESEKAGLQCDIIKLEKEIKKMQKLHGEIRDLKEQNHKLKQDYQKLDDLFNRTEQELYALRDTCSKPSATESKAKSHLFSVPEPDIHTKIKIKGLEFEQSSLKRKNQELEKTLDKLREKYVVLREKHDRITKKPASTTPCADSTSAAVNSPKREAPLNLNTDLGLDSSQECKTQ